MASRLDRLVTLLETGSTQLIRNTAAQQLADIQKKHPHELFNLLTRVVPYLKAKSWDTRTAAAKAIGAIVEHAELFDPNGLDVKPEIDGVKLEAIKDEESKQMDASHDELLHLADLDVETILSQGKKLLGSAGKEYDLFLKAMDPAQRLTHQKKTLNARLGLDGGYTDEDLMNEMQLANQSKPANASPTPLEKPKLSLPERTDSMWSENGHSQSQDVPQTPGGDDSGLSKRQLNMLKRKNRKDLKSQANKVRVVDIAQRRPSTAQEPQTPLAPEPHAIKQESSYENGTDASQDYFSTDRQGGDDNTALVKEFKGPAVPIKSDLQPEDEEEGDGWPYERLCEYFMVDLFDHNWEVRHGAAMGLRDVLRVHGAGAGRERTKSRIQNDLANQKWLDDLACRLCCVFMLDRFGDYVSDNVVVPVRETAGQAIGSLMKFMSPSLVHACFRILHALVLQSHVKSTERVWQACHGGMIGMRYLVAVRDDLLLQDKSLLDGVLEVVMKGLGDFDDDVRAVSAATLIPVSEEIVKLRPSALNGLIQIVWDCLSNLSDDLSASTGYVMDLLAKLCGFPEVLDIMKDNAAKQPEQTFAQLVPRLYPFLRHTITGVRSAALRALLTFLGIEGDGTRDWIDGKVLRLIYQNILVERNEPVLKLSLEVWLGLLNLLTADGPGKLVEALSPHLPPLLTLTFHPVGVSRNPIPMDPSLFIRPSGQVFVLPVHVQSAKSPTRGVGEPASKKRRRSIKQESDMAAAPVSAHNIDGPMITGDIDLVGMDTMIRSKIHAAKALGKVMSLWPEDDKESVFGPAFTKSIQSTFSTTKLTAAMVAEEFAKASSAPNAFGKSLLPSLQNIAEQDSPDSYADLISYVRVVQAQSNALVHAFHSLGHLSQDSLPSIAPKVQGEEDAGRYAFSLQDGEKLVSTDFDRLKKMMSPANRLMATQTLNDTKMDVERSIAEARDVKERRDVRIKAAASAAVVALGEIPKKVSLVIRGLMDSIKVEETIELQQRSAAGTVLLIQTLVDTKRKGVTEKIVGNLVKFYCMDSLETPEFLYNSDIAAGVLSLKKDEDIRDYADQAQHEKEVKEARIKRRGAREALEKLCDVFGQDLFTKVPILQSIIESPLQEVFGTDELPDEIMDTANEMGQRAIDGMSTLKALIGKFHRDLHPFALGVVPLLIKALKSKLAVLRYAAAKCFATLTSVITVEGFSILVKEVLPSISNPHDLAQRQGAIECVYHLIQTMEDKILPYVIFLIVPVLGRMSDSDNDVRLIATTAFATLVKLVPLEAGIPDPPGLSEDMLQGRERERKFMAQMLDPKKVENFEIPVAIKATLRSYQQDGVNWLAFLNRYHLHGILCDDMGLGKTLQTICMVASDHHNRMTEFEKTQNPDMRRLPTLIVCPSTLSGHWKQEIKQYAPFLSAVAYVGPPAARDKVRHELETADIVITSYEICRNDSDFLSPRSWNYCVLDEGHLIKNPAAKTTIAVKQLKSYHRLILSGTPIQNNVLELWSLFDFLMPGFLGTEKIFKDRFAKPIAASRFSKSSSKEQEKGALAVEALHKQVLPFLLRRLKEEVLDDLPPKIVQNYYCDMSELQKRLIEDFSKKETKALNDIATDGSKEAKSHIFTALNYMRKLCNSPALVMREGHKAWPATQDYLRKTKTQITDAQHAPKLLALRDLLVECGIGATDASGSQAGAQNVPSAEDAVAPHRALVFCQMKEMVDMVADQVLKTLLPSATYLRMDGGVEASQRQDIVNQFNSDPSIDLLLLTTQVGGLGLNLTGADTVIFLEHDWNPQKDIQAMDRAHRIGQKRVVNVYRLITRGTLEERIMNLQRFKIDVASQVVQQQKGGLAGMDTGEILDLFNMEGVEAGEAGGGPGGEGAENVDELTGEIKERGKRGFLDDLGELWDEGQYEDELSMDNFLQKMKA